MPEAIPQPLAASLWMGIPLMLPGELAWAAAKQAAGRKRGSGKKPPYPPWPKRLVKPKVHWQESGGITGLSILEEGESEGGDDEEGVDGEGDEEGIDSMRALDIVHFAQVNKLGEAPPVLLFHCFPPWH